MLGRMFRLGVLCSFAIVPGLLPFSATAQVQAVEAMSKTAHPSFDVASVKPSDPNDGSQGFHTEGASLFYENETLKDLVTFAYGVHPKQIVNAPAWFEKDRFDVHGHADAPGEPNGPQQSEMTQKLLAERFGLKVHHDKREMPALSLTVVDAKKLTPNTSGNGLPDQTGYGSGGAEAWQMTNNSMDEFAQFLGGMQERPVVNETGLKGRYDFKLNWLRDAGVSPNHSDLPSLPTALQEQAGLSVKRVQTKVDVLVIDAVHAPSAD